MTAISLTAAKIAAGHSDSSRAEIYNVLLAEAVTKGQVLYQTTAGTFGICDMSTVAKDEPRGLALEAGSAGEAISMVKYGPMFGVDLSGEAYDGLVYAGDAGALDDAGTVAIGRVIGLTDPSKTKFLFVDCREQPVNNGWLELAGVAYISAGVYGTPMVDPNGGTGQIEFISHWLKMTHATGRGYGHRINLEMTGLTCRTSNAIRAELQKNHVSGHAAAGGSAIHAAADLGADNDGHAGLLTGLNAAIVCAADTRSLQGTYAAVSLQTEFKAGNTMPALSTSFIYAADAGTVKAPVFIHFGQAAAADTMVRALTAGGNGAMTIAVNVNGTIWYIPLSATAT